MGIRITAVVVMLGLAACAPIAEPETPPPVPPTKRTPQREPLPPAPSNTPEVIYASAVQQPAAHSSNVKASW